MFLIGFASFYLLHQIRHGIGEGLDLLLLQEAETLPLIVILTPQFDRISSRQSLKGLLLEDGVVCIDLASKDLAINAKSIPEIRFENP